MRNKATSADHSRTTLAALLLALGAIGIAANEIRGLVLAVPVIVALCQSGGTLMAWWVAICSLGGIALSMIVPVWAWKKWRK